MTVTVRLFAILRQRAGRDSMELELPEGARVADALAAVDDLAGGLKLVMAVNREYAAADDVLEPGDELALIPPVSGGATTAPHVAIRAEPLSLDAIAARVRGMVPYDVLVQGEAPRERLAERFRADTDSVLVATSTFWQGIDVPGEALSLLVIDKLPFGAPGDPLVEARCERIEAAGGDWFRDFALPAAMLQLRQGFGRLIRGHDDRGVVAILDPRLRTRPYGRAFLAALPRCPLVDDLGAVASFFGTAVAV